MSKAFFVLPRCLEATAAAEVILQTRVAFDSAAMHHKIT